MEIITYSKNLRITNLDSLPKGTGARYLECIAAHEVGGPLIASAWRRSIPKAATILIDFNAT